MGHLQEKKEKQKTAHQEAQTLDLLYKDSFFFFKLYKDFVSTVLNMLEELKETMDK